MNLEIHFHSQTKAQTLLLHTHQGTEFNQASRNSHLPDTTAHEESHQFHTDWSDSEPSMSATRRKSTKEHPLSPPWTQKALAHWLSCAQWLTSDTIHRFEAPVSFIFPNYTINMQELLLDKTVHRFPQSWNAHSMVWHLAFAIQLCLAMSSSKQINLWPKQLSSWGRAWQTMTYFLLYLSCHNRTHPRKIPLISLLRSSRSNSSVVSTICKRSWVIHQQQNNSSNKEISTGLCKNVCTVLLRKVHKQLKSHVCRVRLLGEQLLQPHQG